jgi:GAF domain-containing protein
MEGGSLLAVIQVERRGQAFHAEDEEAAIRLASVAARALSAAELRSLHRDKELQLTTALEENRRLRLERHAQARRLRESFKHMGVALSAGVNLKETLQTIVEIACRLLQARSGVLRLREGDLLVARALKGDEPVQKLWNVSIPVGEGIVGEVVAYSRPAIVESFGDDDYPLKEHVVSAGIRNLLSVPILSGEGGTALGSLSVHNKRQGAAFTQEDLQAMVAFAAQASGAVEKAMLREKEREAAREASVLRDVAAATASLDLGEVLGVACTKTIEVAEVERCAILLMDPEKSDLRCSEVRGVDPRALSKLREMRIRFDPVADALWQRLSEGQLVTLPMVQAGSVILRRLANHLDVRGGLMVPLKARGGLIGAIYLNNGKGAPPLSEWQRRLVQGISRQLATAIETARVHDQNRRRVRELTALTKVAAAAAQTLDLDEFLDLALRETVETFEADAGSIMLWHPEGPHLKIAAQFGLPERLGRRATRKLGEGVAGWVAEHREPLLAANLGSDPRFRGMVDRSEIHAAMVVPLVGKGQLLGVMSVSAGTEHRPFREDDLSLLTTLARQLSTGIENAKHYGAERRIAQIARDTISPRLPLRVTGLDIGEKHIPAQDVGGDYYDLFPLGDGKVGILVSDVSGKSVAAAMHGAMGKHFLRALSSAYDSPARVLEKVNLLIHQDTPDEVFISAFYGVLDVARGELLFSSAGHCPPLLVSSAGEVRELQGTGMLLGLWPDSQYSEERVHVAPQETLVCYTDGITEAKRAGKLFGYVRLKSCVVKNRAQSAQVIADRLYRRTLTYCGKRVDDDIAILVLKRLEEGYANGSLG